MVTDALRRSRGLLSYGLLAVAGLYLVSGLSLMFKSKDSVGLSFAGKSAAFGYLFASPVLIVSLVAAVTLVTGLGELARNARVVVLAALVIAGLALVLAVITLPSSLGADESGFGTGFFGGVLGAGKVVGVLLGVAQLLLLALSAWFIYSVLRALPDSVPRAASRRPERGYDGPLSSPQTLWSQPGGGDVQRGWSGDPYEAQPDQQGLPASQWMQPESRPAPEMQPERPAPGQPGQERQQGQELPAEQERPTQQSWW